jgi:hypothetical protein
MSGTDALFVVEIKRSVPDPFTPSVVPDEFTLRLSVPADSATAPAATLKGLFVEKITVAKVNVPALTKVVPL